MDGTQVSEADRFNERNEARTWRQKTMRWLQALPRRVRTYGPDVLGTLGVIGVMAWEWKNATLGFDQLFHPGIIWAGIAGVAVCMLALFLHRTAMEEGRAGHLYKSILFGVLALATSCVVWIGVWSNLAADNLNAGDAKIEARNDRDLLKTKAQTLETLLLTLPQPVGLEADKISLTSLEATARQYDLPDLSSEKGGDCDADLDATRRGFCTMAAKLRGRIELAEGQIAARTETQNELNTVNAAIRNFKEVSGAEQFEEMSNIITGKSDDWKKLANIVIMLISIVLFVAAAFVNDYLAERRDRKPEA